ncbi:hypothetical protein ABID29_000702 [Streptococcus rupicaprae]|uniref:Uncharacterized protein n=1 Tax=Streptococcus rupicaprae TaxID=759619 RepID=A0ABV2FGA6_9STRE
MEKSLLFVAIFLFEAFKIGTGTGLGNKGNDSGGLITRTHEENACNHFLVTCFFRNFLENIPIVSTILLISQK